jgi:hypothetical protein
MYMYNNKNKDISHQGLSIDWETAHTYKNALSEKVSDFSDLSDGYTYPGIRTMLKNKNQRPEI